MFPRDGHPVRVFSSDRFARRAVALSKGLAGSVCVIALLVLFGWVANVGALKSVVPGLIEMKANTAIGLFFSGLALFLYRSPATDGSRPATWRRRARQGSAAIAGLIGTLTFGEHLTGWDLGIDQLLFRDPALEEGLYFPGRMAPLSTVNFVLMGAALLLLDRGRVLRSAFVASEYLASAVALTSALVVFGYVFGVTSLVEIQDYTSMAIHTAAGFLLPVSIIRRLLPWGHRISKRLPGN